jgi:hypothetical protein
MFQAFATAAMPWHVGQPSHASEGSAIVERFSDACTARLSSASPTR